MVKGKSRKTLAALAVLFAVVTTLQSAIVILSSCYGDDAVQAQHLTGRYGGTAAGVVSFTYFPMSFCTIPLSHGWSLISLCANVTDPSITTMMTGIDFRYIMRWNQQTQNFDIYSPRQATHPFTTLEYNTSYFVNLNSADTPMPIDGIPVPDINISLVGGWNGPGYPYTFNTTTLRYFNTTDHRYLMKWNASTQSFIIYSPRAAIPTFTTIQTGEGQMLNSNIATQLRYNKTLLQQP